MFRASNAFKTKVCVNVLAILGNLNGLFPTITDSIKTDFQNALQMPVYGLNMLQIYSYPNE